MVQTSVGRKLPQSSTKSIRELILLIACLAASRLHRGGQGVYLGDYRGGWGFLQRKYQAEVGGVYVVLFSLKGIHGALLCSFFS